MVTSRKGTPPAPGGSGQGVVTEKPKKDFPLSPSNHERKSTDMDLMLFKPRLHEAIRQKTDLVLWLMRRGNLKDALSVSGQITRLRELLRILSETSETGIENEEARHGR